MKRLMLSVAVVSLVSGQFAANANPLTDHGVSPDSQEYKSAIAKRMINEFVEIKNPDAPVRSATGSLTFASDEAAQRYYKAQADIKQFEEDVRTGKVILKSDPNYGSKLAYSYIRSTVYEAAKIFAPFALPLGTHLFSNFVLDKVGPSVVRAAGTLGGDVAVSASAFWTWMDPTGTAKGLVRSFGETEARGEALRRLGFIADTAEKYGPAIVTSGYTVGNKVASKVSSLAKSVTERLSGWFGGQSKAAAAA